MRNIKDCYRNKFKNDTAKVYDIYIKRSEFVLEFKKGGIFFGRSGYYENTIEIDFYLVDDEDIDYDSQIYKIFERIKP